MYAPIRVRRARLQPAVRCLTRGQGTTEVHDLAPAPTDPALVVRDQSGTLRTMATYTGTVRKNDLEGGFLELVTDDGTVYRLEGAAGVEAGTKVRVEGKLDKGGFGIQMTGPALVVDTIQAV